jgi:hypothetical protein
LICKKVDLNWTERSETGAETGQLIIYGPDPGARPVLGLFEIDSDAPEIAEVLFS